MVLHIGDLAVLHGEDVRLPGRAVITEVQRAVRVLESLRPRVVLWLAKPLTNLRLGQADQTLTAKTWIPPEDRPQPDDEDEDDRDRGREDQERLCTKPWPRHCIV